LIFFDTSVFVASVLKSDLRHRECLKLVAAATKEHAGCAVHAVTEVYSVLTRIPPPNRLSPRDGLAVVDLIRSRFHIVSLTAAEHFNVIRRVANNGLSGGVVHDAIILECAMKAGATGIYTLNPKDLLRARPDWAQHILEP
jgi:predicted nucleic acid-binding protein